MKVFLDTHVIASAPATRGLCADVMWTAMEFHDLVVSPHLMAELQRVPRDKFGASPELIAEAVSPLHQDTLCAESQPLAPLALKDPGDIAIVSSAINGGAGLLITGDQEVLALNRVRAMKILSPRPFREKERAQSDH